MGTTSRVTNPISHVVHCPNFHQHHGHLCSIICYIYLFGSVSWGEGVLLGSGWVLCLVSSGGKWCVGYLLFMYGLTQPETPGEARASPPGGLGVHHESMSCLHNFHWWFPFPLSNAVNCHIRAVQASGWLMRETF